MKTNTKHPTHNTRLLPNALCLTAIALCAAATACHTTRVYRVTFSNGTYDYYELDYRPDTAAHSIEYNGETIIGVEKIEPLKN